ncbi:MAG: hypothetical protein E7214_07040 [Clostridium sp.]|nr:hypothetical protein [Clostridium sp.]
MNKVVSKIVSLCLVVLITLLVLDYFKIIAFSKMIKDSLSLITLILIVFSSTAVICTNKSGFNKFINALILTSITVGLLFYIFNGKLNKLVYLSLLFTVIYALIDMLYYKKA